MNTTSTNYLVELSLRFIAAKAYSNKEMHAKQDLHCCLVSELEKFHQVPAVPIKDIGIVYKRKIFSF